MVFFYRTGFGKLKMRDGSFYEGQFINGEIDGTGIRYWAHTDNTYEGQFENGEMCGMGVMSFGDGSLYEGAWLNNKMEGRMHFTSRFISFTLLP